MRRILIEAGKGTALAGFVWLVLLNPAGLLAQKNSCIECHSKLEDDLKAPAEAFKLDVHQQYGLSCKDCHGGNPAEDDVDRAKDKTFKGAPKKARVPEFCAGCHSESGYIKPFNPSLRVDQLELYWTSRHGTALKKGDLKVAVCTDCHGVHGIQTAKHPKSLTFPWNIPQTCGRCHADKELMKGYKIPADQLEEYKQSVHARALFEKKDMSAPTCNDCHGNHGAMPPEVQSIAFVCRQCHPGTGELFSKGPHKKAFDEMGFSECEACHGNHKILPPSDAMVGAAEGAVCVQCHDAGSGPLQTAARMRQVLDSLDAAVRQNEAALDKAEKQGVEVSDPKYRLQEVHTLLVSLRNMTHSLDLAAIEQKAKEGDGILADIARSGKAALDEAKFRKSGLVVATALLALFALALFLKIRERGRGKES